MKTIVIYDISDDRKRTKLSDHLKGYGLSRIQYSGFYGLLNSHDRHVLVLEVGRYISGSRDSIYVIPLCDRCSRLVRIVTDRVRGLGEAGAVEYVE